ncbi:MAG: EamA family transporter [Candidatus Eiseniibacteriota bacterium]|nr:MAG: EamA family transporter [Candidatus Eisenbacteria bacterium]
MRTAVYILACVTMLVAGQVLVKHGLNLKGGFSLSLASFWPELSKLLTSGYVWLGAIVTMSSGLLWMDVLSRKELSFVYPLISLTYVVSLIASALLFKESISLLRWLGVVVICFGVYMVSRS